MQILPTNIKKPLFGDFQLEKLEPILLTQEITEGSNYITFNNLQNNEFIFISKVFAYNNNTTNYGDSKWFIENNNISYKASYNYTFLNAEYSPSQLYPEILLNNSSNLLITLTNIESAKLKIIGYRIKSNYIKTKYVKPNTTYKEIYKVPENVKYSLLLSSFLNSNPYSSSAQLQYGNNSPFQALIFLHLVNDGNFPNPSTEIVKYSAYADSFSSGTCPNILYTGQSLYVISDTNDADLSVLATFLEYPK
jgi:hypothetical protein